jgi:copper chaperone CopZ
MESVFKIRKSECNSCTNLVLKSLGTLQGVYGGNIDTINGIINVSHTDEISRDEISKELYRMGYPEIVAPDNDGPSIYGCVL